MHYFNWLYSQSLPFRAFLLALILFVGCGISEAKDAILHFPTSKSYGWLEVSDKDESFGGDFPNQEIKGDVKIPSLSRVRLHVSDDVDLSFIPKCGAKYLIKDIEWDSEKFDDTQLKFLQGLVNLNQLDLENSKITDEGLKYLASCKRIGFLNLSNTKITDAGLKHLLPLSQLFYLNLSHTSITDDSFETLSRLKSIHQLYLEDTGVSYEVAEKLLAILPIIDGPDMHWIHTFNPVRAGKNPKELELKKIQFPENRKVGTLDILPKDGKRKRVTPDGGWLNARGAIYVSPEQKIIICFRNGDTYSELTDDEFKAWAKNCEAGAQIEKIMWNSDAVPHFTEHHLQILVECFPNLKSLNVYGLNDSSILLLKRLSSLKELSFERSQFSNNIYALFDFKNLEALAFTACKFNHDEPLQGISNLGQLDYLGLAESNIRNSDMVHIATLENLRRLDLSYTEINDEGLRELTSLPKLQSIELNRTKITDAALPMLLYMNQKHSLKWVELEGTSISETALKDTFKETKGKFSYRYKGLTHYLSNGKPSQSP